MARVLQVRRPCPTACWRECKPHSHHPDGPASLQPDGPARAGKQNRSKIHYQSVIRLPSSCLSSSVTDSEAIAGMGLEHHLECLPSKDKRSPIIRMRKTLPHFMHGCLQGRRLRRAAPPTTIEHPHEVRGATIVHVQYQCNCAFSFSIRSWLAHRHWDRRCATPGRASHRPGHDTWRVPYIRRRLRRVFPRRHCEGKAKQAFVNLELVGHERDLEFLASEAAAYRLELQSRRFLFRARVRGNQGSLSKRAQNFR